MLAENVKTSNKMGFMWNRLRGSVTFISQLGSKMSHLNQPGETCSKLSNRYGNIKTYVERLNLCSRGGVFGPGSDGDFIFVVKKIKWNNKRRFFITLRFVQNDNQYLAIVH